MILLFIVFLIFAFFRLVKKCHTIRRRRILKQSRFLINRELNYVWGMPGSGKSTLLASVAQCCYEMGIPCFSSYPIDNCYKFQGFDVTYPVGSVFLLDEIYDMVGSGTNRGIPDTNVTMFFKKFRHSRYTIWACSQESDDVARRVRGVVTSAFLIRNRGKKSVLIPAEIREVKNVDGEKFELSSNNIIVQMLTNRYLYRPDFYSTFDSYSRTIYKLHSQFEAW